MCSILHLLSTFTATSPLVMPPGSSNSLRLTSTDLVYLLAVLRRLCSTTLWSMTRQEDYIVPASLAD